MTIIAIAGILLLAAGVMILVFTLLPDKQTSAVSRIETYSFESAVAATGDTAARRPLDSMASRLGEAAARRMSRFKEDEIRKRLVGAGMYETSSRKLLGYQLLLAIFLTLLMLWLVPLLGGSGLETLALSVGAGVLGWFLPMGYVARRRRLRHEQIERTLPDFVDLLVVTVEAGVGLLGSLRIAADNVDDPLGQELRLTLQEQRMGLAVGEAIDNLAVRVDTSGMRMFVRALTQGERLGVSIGTTLRNLADEMRKRRRAMIEERVQKLPIKMLFPLIFLIFPGIFIILLGPAFMHIRDQLG